MEDDNKKIDSGCDKDAQRECAGCDSCTELCREDVSTDYKKLVQEEKDKYMRLYSEFLNYKRRMNSEMNDLIVNAEKKLLMRILPIVDDFERAINNMADNEGVKIIFNKLQNLLQQSGVKVIEIKNGDDFDEEKQEAIVRQPVESVDMHNKIVDIVEKGYTLNNKIIRFAKVIVGEFNGNG